MDHPEDGNIYERLQLGVVTDVKPLMGDDEQPTEFFSGYVSVRLLTSCEEFHWVKWSYPHIGQSNKSGIIACPSVDDVVVLQFDPRGYPVVLGTMLYSQAVKPIYDQTDFTTTQTPEGEKTKESDDLRLKLKQGEVMVRGSNGTSVHFRNDGTTILKLDDTKEDADTTVIGVDVNKNIFILGAQNVTVKGTETARVECKNAEIEATEKVSVKADEATVEASQAKVISDNIELGGSGVKAAIIRELDKAQHIDPVIGVPVVSVRYLTKSKSTKAT